MQSRYKYIQRLNAGVKVPSVFLTYSPGTNKGNLHFIWQIDCTDSTTETIFQKSLPVVSLKESAFEPSFPLRHMAELYKSLVFSQFDKPMLCMYTDGGPDHRITYVSVKLAYIALFLKLDLDYLVTARIPP